MEGEGEDGQLAAEVAAGNVDALALVYEAHGARVFSLARRILGDGRLAEKVVEEVFVGLWDEAHAFDQWRGSLGAHLLCQARSRSHELLWRRGRTDDPQPKGAAMSPPELDLLPEEETRAIELAFFGGYSCRQVAELLEVPEPTVRKRLRLGLKRPRLAMPEEGQA